MGKKKKKNKLQVEDSTSPDYSYYLKVKEEYLNRAKNKEEYGVKQVDAMLVALSTAGLGFTLNYLKGIDTNEYLFLAYTSQIMFLSCLILMLFAHLCSKEANAQGTVLLEHELAEDQPWREELHELDKVKSEIFKDRLNRGIRRWNTLIKILNITSFMTLITAIILFVIFTFLA